MEFKDLCLAAGGLALFLMGMSTASRGLQQALGGTLRTGLALLTRHRLLAVGVGIVLTVVLASSSATTVLLVGLADAGVIATGQSLAVVLGSDIGTALTLQLIAFKIGGYAGLVVAAGFFGRLLAKHTRAAHLWQALMGLGFIFLGLEVMGQGIKPVIDTPAARRWLFDLLANPWTGCLAATIVTAVIQSSAATIALGFTFMAGGLTLEQAIPLVLGANLGTCATALYAALGASRRGRQIAVAHTLFKLVGVIVVLPLAGPFAHAVQWMSVQAGADQPARQLVNAHLAFNILLTVAFLPLLGLVARLIERFMPLRGGDTEGILEHIRPHHLQEPAKALGRLHRDTIRIGRQARELVRKAVAREGNVDGDVLDDILAADDRIDLGVALVTDYLLKLPDETLTPDQRALKRKLFHTAQDFEAVGDVVSKQLVALGRKQLLAGDAFSVQDQQDLVRLHEEVLEGFDWALRFFERDEAELGKKVLAAENSMADRLRGAYDDHLQRMDRGVREAIRTSAVYLDTVRALREIHSHLADIVRVLEGSRPGGAT